jgi:predicted glycosyltransferase
MSGKLSSPMKKILVDINHPAHVHLFKYFIRDMRSRGHEVVVTAKNVDSITKLLRLYKISYIDTGSKKDHILWKYLYEFFHLVKVLRIAVSRRLDYGIGVSMVLPIVSKLTSMKSFALDDDDLSATPLFGKFTSYADVILNPEALAHENRGSHRICHPSYHELAYLHPNRFRPDPSVLEELGLKPDEPFFVLRFNAFKAHHDTGARGLSIGQKLELVKFLEKFGRIFITTERTIEPALEPYQLPVSPEKIHTLLYYATLFVGDSQTMTTEAALLGTPAIKLNSFAGQLSIPNEIEQKYHLCHSFQPEEFEAMMQKVSELVLHANIKSVWRMRQAMMLNDKVDLTSFLTELVLNYPQKVANTRSEVAYR